jgi:hypothetical protein
MKIKGVKMTVDRPVRMTFRDEKDPDLSDYEDFLESVSGNSTKDKIMKLIRLYRGGNGNDLKVSIQICQDLAMVNMLVDYFEDGQPQKARILKTILPMLVNNTTPQQVDMIEEPLKARIDELWTNSKKKK